MAINVEKELVAEGFQPGTYVVIGSGILGALGIRPINDIDVVVTPQVYADLKGRGWTEEPDHGGHLVKDLFDVWPSWVDGSATELLARATIIDGIAYWSLLEVLDWKRKKARPKDIQDCQLIEAYLQRRDTGQQ